MKKQNVRTISLIVCIFTFLLVGAAIFDALESDYEAEDLRELMHVKTHFTNKYNITNEDFRNISVLVKRLIPHNARQWKFAGAFYYSVTVMTTIGYGHSTPRTLGGKAFTMLYAFTGIPLGLVMFQSIGERLNVFATFLLANIKKCFRFKNSEVSQTNLIVIDTTLALTVVFVSAAVFDHYESWGYWNAVYYCFITLTTVGFGDMVPLQTGESDLERRPEYVVFTLMFILFGLTVLSANMNLMVLRFMTVNTEDERRDEMEAAVAALTAVKVDGDVIYGTKPPLPPGMSPDFSRKPPPTFRSSSPSSKNLLENDDNPDGSTSPLKSRHRQNRQKNKMKKSKSKEKAAQESKDDETEKKDDESEKCQDDEKAKENPDTLEESPEKGDSYQSTTRRSSLTAAIGSDNDVLLDESAATKPGSSPPLDQCDPANGHCVVPNCRHEHFCKDGPTRRNPQDACSCSCHQDKAWWSYLLKLAPNQLPSSDSFSRHYQQRGTRTSSISARSPNLHLHNAQMLLKGESETAKEPPDNTLKPP